MGPNKTAIMNPTDKFISAKYLNIPIVDSYNFLGVTVTLRKVGKSKTKKYDTVFGHAKSRATKLAPNVKQLQRFLRSPQLLEFTVMKVKRLIISVFVGCLYGITPGKDKKNPPA